VRESARGREVGVVMHYPYWEEGCIGCWIVREGATSPFEIPAQQNENISTEHLKMRFTLYWVKENTQNAFGCR
jgi:hypothetical protein